MSQSAAAFNPAVTEKAAPAATWKDLAHSRPVLRQTQAMIGVMLLIGTALTVFVDIAFAVIPAFVGFALIIAGVTGVCPMAFVFAKMPWNRNACASKDGACCGCS